TFRDYVIGISTINDEGQETKAGGRVVKNVAGYDLCKLHIGALGTLGIITQVTLKLRPMPEESALAIFHCDSSELENLVSLLQASRTRRVCIDGLNGRAARELPPDMGQGQNPPDAWVIIVGYEDSADTVRWQMSQLIKELSTSKAAGLDARVNAAGRPLWDFLCEFPLRQATLTFKANLLPHAVADFCRLADTLDETILLQAHAGNGIVVGHVSGPLTAERASAMLK